MRMSQAFAYLQEPSKPTADRKLRYTHIDIAQKALEEKRKLRRRQERMGRTKAHQVSF